MTKDAASTTTDTGAAAAVDAAAAGIAANPENSEFANALREATAAKAGKPADADDKASTASADTAGDKTAKTDAAADTAGASDKSAGADTAASKTAAESSPKSAEITVDWSKVKPAVKAAYDAGTPEQKDAIESLIVDRLKAGRQEADRRKAVSDARAARRRPPASTSSRTSRAAFDPTKAFTGAAMAALEKDAPEVTSAVKEALAPLLQEVAAANKDLDAVALQGLQAEADYQQGILADEHPDWQTATATKDFGEWLAKQPPHVKAAVARNATPTKEFPQGRIIDGEEAADVLTRFKDSTGFGSAAGDEPPAGAKKNGTEGSQQPSPVDKKRELQRATAKTTDLRGVPASTGVAEDDFAGNLRAATAAKARERQARQTA